MSTDSAANRAKSVSLDGHVTGTSRHLGNDILVDIEKGFITQTAAMPMIVAVILGSPGRMSMSYKDFTCRATDEV